MNKVTEILKKEKVLSFSNIMIMTITFLVLGVFLTVIFVSQSALEFLEQQTQVTVFFEDAFPENQIMELKTSLEQEERVAQVEYVSKQEALEIFTEINKDEPLLIESITANILPASLKIQTHKVGDLEVIAEQMAQEEGVEGVKFFKDVISNFRNISKIIYIAGFILTAVFLFISYSAIVITLRTYINRKGTELEILKLVGASNEYIRAPIISQGMFFSITSSILATIILVISATIATFLGIVETGFLVPFTTGWRVSVLIFSAILGILLVISGAILGYIGSTSTVKKYLEY